MQTRFDYTTLIRRANFRYPFFSALIVQISFWCTSYIVLGILLHFVSKAVTSSFNSAAESKIMPLLVSSLAIGVLYGVMLGFIDYYLLRRWSKGKSLGRLIIVKVFIYFITMNILFVFIKFILWQDILLPLYFQNSFEIKDKVWLNYFIVIAVFTLFMDVFISFFIQINKKFGPGVLLPFILGKYVQPQIEERSFIFLDLKSSTSHAENLGHKKYSRLIRDCFLDINYVSTNYNAEIYQYVGDEIVLTWLVNESMKMAECFHFYFDCQKVFKEKKNYYQKEYGFVPEFKAGLHSGIVTCVEVGDVKREIAYHGDTLNIASRIQAKCNENNADIIFTSSVQEKLGTLPFAVEEIGNVFLKGKMKPVLIYKVNG